MTARSSNAFKPRRLLIAVALLLAAATIALAADVDGQWTGSIDGPNGSMALTFTFKTQGTALTGTVDSPNGSLPISDGKIDGDKISFKTQFNGDVIDHEGTVSGDTMQLKVTGPWGESDLTLKRSAPPASKPSPPPAN
jgi:FlaG/FlaF family flagellin (archaellin)